MTLPRASLYFLLCFLLCVLLRAPVSLAHSAVQHFSKDRLSLLDTQGSVWQGQGRLAVRDDNTGLPVPLTALRWHWQSSELLRGRLGWQLSAAGLPAFSLHASPFGIAADSVSIGLPIRELVSQLPNTFAGMGWHGDIKLNVPQWRCNWRQECSGLADILWRGAAADLFPGRVFGDYHLQITADKGGHQLKLNTLSGSVVLNAQGKFTPPQQFNLAGSIEGEASFVGRLPEIAPRIVQPTGTPGKLSFSLQQP